MRELVPQIRKAHNSTQTNANMLFSLAEREIEEEC